MVTFGSLRQVSSFSGVCGRLLGDLVDVFSPLFCSLSSQPKQRSCGSLESFFLCVLSIHSWFPAAAIQTQNCLTLKLFNLLRWFIVGPATSPAYRIVLWRITNCRRLRTAAKNYLSSFSLKCFRRERRKEHFVFSRPTWKREQKNCLSLNLCTGMEAGKLGSVREIPLVLDHANEAMFLVKHGV